MIRTAILTGILLILISIAYSKPNQLTSLSAASDPVLVNLPEQPPAIKAVPAHQTRAKAEAPRVEPVAEETADAETSAPSAQVEAPVVGEHVVAVAPEPAPVAEAARPVAPATPPAGAPLPERAHNAPTLLVPPPGAAPAPPAVVAEAAAVPPPAALPATAAPQSLLPPTSEAAPLVVPKVAQAPPPPAESLPMVNVATRPNVMPWEAPAGTTHNSNIAGPEAMPETLPETNVAAAAPAPKFMTPQERSRDLHRLARDMEDTFITKLAH